MKTGSHFVNYGLPEHTNYSEQVVRDTTWYTYEWILFPGGAGRGAACLIDERGYVVLYDYTQRPFFTTLYESISDVVEVLKLVLLSYVDIDREQATVLITQCFKSSVSKVVQHGSYVLKNVMLSEVSKKYLKYREFTITEVGENETLLTW